MVDASYFAELYYEWTQLASEPWSPEKAVKEAAMRANPDLEKAIAYAMAQQLLGITPFVGVSPTVVAAEKAIIGTASDDTKLVRHDFLTYEALVLGGICLAPVLVKAGIGPRRGKRAKTISDLGEPLENASNRATTLVAALAPAFGMPLAYITVQALEGRNVISHGLGDSVQTLIAAMAAGQAATGFGSIIGSLVKAL